LVTKTIVLFGGPITAADGLVESDIIENFEGPYDIRVTAPLPESSVGDRSQTQTVEITVLRPEDRDFDSADLIVPNPSVGLFPVAGSVPVYVEPNRGGGRDRVSLPGADGPEDVIFRGETESLIPLEIKVRGMTPILE
jgi:hypothetical protein